MAAQFLISMCTLPDFLSVLKCRGMKMSLADCSRATFQGFVSLLWHMKEENANAVSGSSWRPLRTAHSNS